MMKYGVRVHQMAGMVQSARAYWKMWTPTDADANELYWYLIPVVENSSGGEGRSRSIPLNGGIERAQNSGKWSSRAPAQKNKKSEGAGGRLAQLRTFVCRCAESAEGGAVTEEGRSTWGRREMGVWGGDMDEETQGGRWSEDCVRGKKGERCTENLSVTVALGICHAALSIVRGGAVGQSGEEDAGT
ncbi:hypothetical protein B0H19DRAFT_1086428 [Mycena capillaripes]|nr:hypothetical protein B0H19DRAFT_1086428 [Mycena capillaripes]